MMAAAAVLSSCASIQQLELTYTPEPQTMAGLASKTFNVVVTDERPLVASGDKQAWYIGRYRAVFGAPSNVANHKKVALAEQMRADLARELASLGLAEAPSAPSKRLKVRIYDWDFDAGKNGRVWYDVSISVADSRGQLLASSQAKDEKLTQGSVIEGAKYAMQEDIPVLYGELIRKLVRDDPKIIEALRSEP